MYESWPRVALLRHHPPPNSNKVEDIQKFLQARKIDMNFSSSKDLHSCIQSLETKYPKVSCVKQIVEEYCTKCMQRANYICSGDISEPAYHHYSLNVPFYTHFTSPIRRYADLTVHRLVFAALKGTPLPPSIDKSQISTVAEHLNKKKNAATNAQQQSELMYLATFLDKNRTEDNEAVVTEIDKNYLVVYSKKLGLTARCFYKNTAAFKTEWGEKALIITWELKPTGKPTPDQQQASETKRCSYTFFQKVKVYFRPTDTRPPEVEAVLLLD